MERTTSQVSNKASQVSNEYESFFSDSQKNNEANDSNDASQAQDVELPPEFKSNIDKLVAEDYASFVEDHEEEKVSLNSHSK